MNLNDPTNPRVITALTRKCGVCQAPIGEHCKSLTILPLDRIVHLYRLEKP